MGFILGFPFSGHRYEHIAHHRHTNHAELDPDFQIGDMGRSPLHAVRSAFRLLSGQYGYYLKHQWHRASAREKSVMATETVLAWAARIAFMAQGYWMEGVLMFVVGSLLGLIALIYLFAYIVHRPHTAVERYLDTSTIVLRGPANNLLTWCWLFQNYHSIHHLFPKVPFYKYKALFEEIEPIMRAKGAPIYELTGGGLKPIPA
jgi:beta-carotene hydroxylase